MSSFLRIKQCARSLLGFARIFRTDTALNVGNAYENRPSFVQPFRSFAGTNVPCIDISQLIAKSLAGNADTKLRAVLEAESFETALPLLRQLKSQSVNILEEYFWPHILSQRDVPSILNVIAVMRDDFGIVQPSGSTIRNCIAPALARHLDPNRLVTALQYDVGCKAQVAANSVVYHLLSVYKWKEALAIASRYKLLYRANMYQNNMIQALIVTKDADSFVQFLRIVYDSTLRARNLPATSGIDQKSIVGRILADTAKKLGSNHAELFKDVLRATISHGLNIKSHQRHEIEHIFGDGTAAIDADLSQMLTLLTSGILQPAPVARKPTYMSRDETRRLHKLTETPELITATNYHSLLMLYYTKGQTENFVELVRRLEADAELWLENGIYHKWIGLLSKSNDFKGAIQIYNRVKGERPDFEHCHSSDCMKYVVNEFINDNKIDEAIEFLTTQWRYRIRVPSDVEVVQPNIEQLLNLLADRGRTDDVQRVCDTFMELGCVTVNNHLMSPLVSVHLVNDDLEQAVDTFENLCIRYNLTPYQKPLMRQLVQCDRVADLQRIVDLSSKVHGELRTLINLSLAFVEGDRKSQAKQIIETLDARKSPSMYTDILHYYARQGETEYLQCLFEITKGLLHFDRNSLYDCLLRCHCSDNNTEAILALWKERIGEALPISDKFSRQLGEYIEANGVEIPFDVPAVETEALGLSVEEPKSETVSSKEITSRQLWSTVENLVKESHLDEATTTIVGAMQAGLRPPSRVLNFLVQRLALNGNVERLTTIEACLNPNQMRKYSIDNRLCVAYNQSGRGEEYIQYLADRLNNCKTDDEIRHVAERFPLVAHCILETLPQSVDSFRTMAELYAQKEKYEPINVLWMYLFVEGLDEPAQQIWSKYLSRRPVLLSKYILMKARANNDYHLVEKLTKQAADSNISSVACGCIYSRLIDIYSALHRYKDGLAALRRAEAAIGLQYIHKHSLNRLENGLKELGIK